MSRSYCLPQSGREQDPLCFFERLAELFQDGMPDLSANTMLEIGREMKAAAAELRLNRTSTDPVLRIRLDREDIARVKERIRPTCEQVAELGNDLALIESLARQIIEGIAYGAHGRLRKIKNDLAIIRDTSETVS